MLKALVTGGAGFIGSHLIDKLIGKGYEVYCLDNLITGSEGNIAHLKDNPNFKFINHDITEPLPEELTVDQVYHLASPASPNHNSKKSYHALAFETMRVNTTGTWYLAELATKLGAKFLFASTSEIYGDPLEHPQKETYRGNVSTTGPRSVYDESKRFGETITQAFIRKRGLDGRIIRVFNTYGPRLALDDGRVVGEFVEAALKGESLQVFGDGTQTRSFCYVSDLVEGIVLAMEKENTKGEVFNLGNPDEYKIIDLALKIKDLTNSSSETVITGSLPEDDPKQRRPDIEKAKKLLGWEPKVGLAEGLTMFIKYINSSLAQIS